MSSKNLRPLSFAPSLLFFAGSAGLFRLAVYQLLPALVRTGMVAFTAFLLSYSIPLLLLIVATFVALAKEGTLAEWPRRLRLVKLTGRQVLLCLGIFMLGFLAAGLLLPTARYLAATRLLAPPSFLPAILNPTKAVPGQALTTFMGVPLHGAYWVLGVYFIFLTFFNIMGEELWFRGYLLPRQELVWGRHTWLVHGLLWGLFHVPIYPWAIIYLLPTTLTVSFAAQKCQSTWAGFIVHYLGNGLLALVPIGLGVIR